ncbi:MAG: MFS transporter [Akkermansiaceae bacterium]|nr:MFS transporter [Akkermansiaceae bacterium]
MFLSIIPTLEDLRSMTLATGLFTLLCVIGFGALVAIIRNYYRGLRGSPRELWLIITYKFIEYSAYAAMNMVFILWLSADCGLTDIEAGSFITGWSLALSAIGMVVGALVDTVGIRRTCLLSVAMLLFSRAVMAFVTDPTWVFILGFLPLALGFAIVGPVVSVAIKRYTTKEGAAMGFGLFYVVMNIGYAVGGLGFDAIRGGFTRTGANGVVNTNAGTDLFGVHFTTYQLFFVFGTAATVVSLLALLPMREGVERTEKGITVTPPVPSGKTALGTVQQSIMDTGRLIGKVFSEKYFWIFMGLICLTLFVRFVFFHFHYTFPKYGLRVLGPEAKIGNIYGVLNPVLIVFLVPIVALVTKKVCSFRMLLIGASISATSCFIALIPPEAFAPLTHSVLGEMIFVNWLRMAPDAAALAAAPPTPAYWPLIVFILVFTIGEAIWSPRLMQFSAEIAPKGRESTYLALSVLPSFAAKLVVGPLSGILLHIYTPVDEVTKAVLPHPNHAMIWFWVGLMALPTPIGLLLCGKWINRQTKRQEEIQVAEERAEEETVER